MHSRADQPQRFQRLVEAHGDPRGDVAVGLRGHPHGQLIVGPPRLVAAQVGALRARTAGEARETELLGQRRQHLAGTDETILQAGMFVEHRTQRAHLGFDRVALARQRVERAGAGIHGHPAGHHRVHHQSMTEGQLGGPQPVFAQARELRQRERQGRVVAERAEVAEVIGDPLTLQHQRAQPAGTYRNDAACRRLERHAVCPRIRNRAVTRHPSGKAMPLERGQFGETPLHALVHVAEALLQAQHLLADHREAEVARLDDPGMYRTDRDLVNAVAFDVHERIVVGKSVGGNDRQVGVVAQRARAGLPQPVVEPGPRVARSGCADAEQVRRGALHARGIREGDGEVRPVARRFEQPHFDPREPLRQRIGRVRDEAAVGRAPVAAPQCDQPAARDGDRTRQQPTTAPRRPVRGRSAAPRATARSRGRGRKSASPQPPIMRAASRYHASR